MKRLAAPLIAVLVGMFAHTLTAAPAGSVSADEKSANACTKVGVIGDSKSDYLIGARFSIERELLDRGMPYYLTTSGGRSVREAGVGTDRWTGNGLQSVATAKAAGADCFVVALGGNDAAFSNGDRELMSQDIISMLDAIGPDHKVDWVTTNSRRAGGPWSDRNLQKFTKELDRIAENRPNLDVNHWEDVPESLPDWWSPDGLHLNKGNLVRGQYVVDSVFIDGSR